MCDFFNLVVITVSHDMATDQARRLREALKERPQSCKLIALLSIELSTRAAGSNGENRRQEALMLARTAIDLCNTRPVGHYALSLASPQHSERIESLQMVAKLWTPACAMALSGLATALVRLLVEPREEEGKQNGISITSSKHPSTRNLNAEEQRLYVRILKVLQGAREDPRTTTGVAASLAQAEYRLGLFFRKMEPVDINGRRSLHHFTMTIDILPNDVSLARKAQFWKATQTDAIVDKCPPEYIVGLYASFAERFDELLVAKLNYETPTKLRQLVDLANSRGNHKWLLAADLGCGTGLSGLAFRDCVDSLVGVDLSPEMIERARARGCYDALFVGDVVSILTNADEFEIVLACDVFVYLGDLTEVFAAAQQSLKKNGIFAFSTEYLDAKHVQPFKLQKSARFAHKQSYIESLASSFDYRIVQSQKCPLRKNAGADVDGLLFVMAKD